MLASLLETDPLASLLIPRLAHEIAEIRIDTGRQIEILDVQGNLTEIETSVGFVDHFLNRAATLYRPGRPLTRPTQRSLPPRYCTKPMRNVPPTRVAKAVAKATSAIPARRVRRTSNREGTLGAFATRRFYS